MIVIDDDSPILNLIDRFLKQMKFFGACGPYISKDSLAKFVPRVGLLANLLHIPAIEKSTKKRAIGWPYVYNTTRWNDSSNISGYLSADDSIDMGLYLESLLLMWNC